MSLVFSCMMVSFCGSYADIVAKRDGCTSDIPLEAPLDFCPESLVAYEYWPFPRCTNFTSFQLSGTLTSF